MDSVAAGVDQWLDKTDIRSVAKMKKSIQKCQKAVVAIRTQRFSAVSSIDSDAVQR